MSAQTVAPNTLSIRHNLPAEITSFVGRSSEIADIAALLADQGCRLLTLVGPGGIGKTRLAIQVARQALDDFAHGVYFVPLQPLSSADNIVMAVAKALRYHFADIDRNLTGFDTQKKYVPRQQLLDYLREKQVLLVMDNFEHVLAGADLVVEIIETAPQVKILATSREALNLQEEWVRPVQGMRHPEDYRTDSLEDYSAVRLFVERANQVVGDFSLQDEREAVVRICQLVEGMPLGIELAVTWLRALSGAEIANEIQRNVDILSTSARNVPERHRSIRAIFDHSWNMLSAEEQRVYRWLSVFRGGATRRAIQAITGASLQILSALVDKSLLQSETGRYRIHALLSQYAQEKLAEAGEVEAARDAHSAYFASFLQERGADILGRRQLEALDEIETDLENIRTGWKWAVERKDYDAIGRAAECLCLFMWMRARWRDGEDLLSSAQERFAPEPGESPHPLWGRLLVRYHRHLDDPKPQIEKALAIAREHNDTAEIALGLYQLGFDAYDRADYATALPLLEESLTYYNDVDDDFHVGEVVRIMGWIHGDLGDHERMFEYARHSLEIQREIGDVYGKSYSLGQMGTSMFLQGNFAEAERYKREALTKAREISNRFGIAWMSIELGGVLAFGARGDLQDAQALVEEGHIVATDINNASLRLFALIFCSLFASLAGDETQARQYYNEVMRLPPSEIDIVFYWWGWALAACEMGDFETVRRCNGELLCSFQPLFIAPFILAGIPITAIVLANKNQNERAVELLALACTHPKSMTGWLQVWPFITRLKEELRGRLGAEAYAAAWERGTALDLDLVARQLLAGLDEGADEDEVPLPTRIQAANQSLIESLSDRELEVLQLVSAGNTNREIAEQLFIGVSTVKKHITHIYGKLGVDNRTRAIVRAQELNLV